MVNRRLLPTYCLSALDHFAGLALKGLGFRGALRGAKNYCKMFDWVPKKYLRFHSKHQINDDLMTRF